jgi:hypothetical protein
LVSLTFHQASTVATADPFPDAGGHFTSVLRHIGSSDVLAYDDIRNPVFQPATTKQNRDFNNGKMRHAPVAALYYLVGGEATQEALYQQHLEYLYTHFGISIHLPTHTEQWQWPSSASLSPHIPGNFKEFPHSIVKAHFNTIHHKSHHIELKQGYSAPKPKPRFTGVQTTYPSTSQGSGWQYTPTDPTEQFFAQVKGTAQAKRQIVLDALSCIPSTINLFAISARVEEGLMEWDMDNLVDLSLWGSSQEDEIDFEEELDKQRARRRAKGFRSPSPPRHSNYNIISMLEIVNGK